MGEEPTYIIEVDERESRLPDSASVCAFLQRLAGLAALDCWVFVDRGRRRRTLLQRLFGLSDRDVEPCFHLIKASEVASLTFLDDRWSEYRVTDADHPTEPTDEQRMALSAGEPIPAPVEVCLRADRALRAAIEYLQSGERPSWLTYRYVR